ncbi:MAG: flagellin FliC, partial [Gammaproteobacteria bacterium]|nr:flagellin FliC [Gammaproteobacteria bacterium]
VTLLTAEIDRVADKLTFNGTKVIGASAAIAYQVGTDAGDKLSVNTINVTNIHSGATVDTVANASVAIGKMDAAITAISKQRGIFGATQNRMESVIRTNDTAVENLSASRSRVLDADFAAESANLTRTQILQQAGAAMLSQANALPQNVLSLLG